MMTEQKPDSFDDPFVTELRSMSKQLLPDSAFVNDLAAQLVNTIPQSKRHHLPSALRVAAGLAASLILIAALVLTVPSLRVLAQEILDSLFNRTQTDSETLPYTVGGAEEVFYSVAAAEQSLQMDILEPTTLPEGVQLHYVLRLSPNDAVLQLYEYPAYLHWSLMISQYNSPNTSVELEPIGSSATIQPVTLYIAGQEIEAEYVKGGWQVSGDTFHWGETQPGEVLELTSEWDSDAPNQRLSWQFGNTVVTVRTGKDAFMDLQLEDLIAIAESMH